MPYPPNSPRRSTTKRIPLLFSMRLSYRVSVKLHGSWFAVWELTAYIDGLECGGAYMKLLQDNKALHAEEFSNASPYVIMFGPDKCGATNKVSNARSISIWTANR